MSSKPPMTYLVNITARAERDLAELYRAIHAEHSAVALRWYRGSKDSILRLEVQPNRCPVFRKKQKIRNLLYGKKPQVHRVIYRVAEKRKQVDVLHIRHGARRKIKPRDLT